MSEALLRRVTRVEKYAELASRMTPEDVRKMRLTFFRLRGIIHFLAARLPGLSPETYPREEVDGMIRAVLEGVGGGISSGMTDTDIEVMVKLRAQEFVEQLVMRARELYEASVERARGEEAFE